MKTFDIEPYVGALPITFDMTPAEVESLLGSPGFVKSNFLNQRQEYRDHNELSICYSTIDNRVSELEFSLGIDVRFRGNLLFAEPDLLGFLMRYDPCPYELVGTVIFMKLGITTGHGEEESKTVTAFRQGAWDELIESATPFRR